MEAEMPERMFALTKPTRFMALLDEERV